MGQFEKLFFSLIFIGLMVFGILQFSFSFQDENAVGNKLINNSLMNNTYVTLQNDLGSLRDDAQEQKDLFEQEDATSGFGSILLFSIIGVGKTFNSMVVGVSNTVLQLPVTFLGLDPVVVSVLTTLLIIVIILGLWRLYKLGG